MSQTVPLVLNDDCEKGGHDYDESGIESDFAYRNNVAQATKLVRLAFIRKVYGLLSMQLLLTVLVVSVFMFTPPIKTFVQTNDWMLGVTFISSIVLLIALHFKRLEYPTNFILLVAFTVAQAYAVAVIVTFSSQTAVLQALLLTFLVLGCLTAYTFQTKYDFSAMYSGLFAGLFVLIMGGFLQIFFRSTVLEVVISLAGVLIFCLFIIYDTQLLMNTLSPEEYILATINLYLDIINLFIYILRLLQAVRQ